MSSKIKQVKTPKKPPSKIPTDQYAPTKAVPINQHKRMAGAK